MKIFVLDDDARRHAAFDEAYADSHVVDHAWSYWDAIGMLKDSDVYDIVYLDHDLNDFESASFVDEMYGRRELTGLDVARFIAKQLPHEKRPPSVIVHSWNPDGARAMVNILTSNGIHTVYSPFGEHGD